MHAAQCRLQSPTPAMRDLVAAGIKGRRGKLWHQSGMEAFLLLVFTGFLRENSVSVLPTTREKIPVWVFLPQGREKRRL